MLISWHQTTIGFEIALLKRSPKLKMLISAKIFEIFRKKSLSVFLIYMSTTYKKMSKFGEP